MKLSVVELHLIRTLVIWIGLAPRVNLLRTLQNYVALKLSFIGSSTSQCYVFKTSNQAYSEVQVQYNVMSSRTSVRAYCKGLDAVRTANSRSRTSNCQCGLFSKANPVIRIFCISRWLAVPNSPNKWRSTVLESAGC